MSQSRTLDKELALLKTNLSRTSDEEFRYLGKLILAFAHKNKSEDKQGLFHIIPNEEYDDEYDAEEEIYSATPYELISITNQLIQHPFDETLLLNFEKFITAENLNKNLKDLMRTCADKIRECQNAYEQLNQALKPTLKAGCDKPVLNSFQVQGQRVLNETSKLKSTLAINDLTQIMRDTRTLVADPFIANEELLQRYKEQADKLSHQSALKTALGTLAFFAGAAILTASVSAIVMTLGISTPFSALGFAFGAGLVGLASWLGVSSTVAFGVSAFASAIGLGGAIGGGITFFKNVTKTQLAKEMDTLLEMTQDNGDDGFIQETVAAPSFNS